LAFFPSWCIAIAMRGMQQWPWLWCGESCLQWIGGCTTRNSSTWNQVGKWNNKIKAPPNCNQSKCFPISTYKKALEIFQMKIKVLGT
jgi:hypothetical protein